MSTLAERIKRRRTQLGLTQVEVAERAEIRQQSYQALEKGETLRPRKPIELAKALQVSVDWLLNGTEDNDIEIQEQQNTTERYIIDMLNISASAGTGLINNETVDVVRSIEYNTEEARIIFSGRSSNNIKVINIKGDSMSGTLEAGDLAYVDISINHFDSDGIYVFIFGKSLFVKRLQLIKNVLRVKSDNPNYDHWDIHEDEMDQLYIQGKVLLGQSMHLKKYG